MSTLARLDNWARWSRDRRGVGPGAAQSAEGRYTRERLRGDEAEDRTAPRTPTDVRDALRVFERINPINGFPARDYIALSGAFIFNLSGHELRGYLRRGYRTNQHIGSREQLLAAGVIGPDTPMPGDPGQRKGFIRLSDNPHRIESIKPSTPGRFTVEVRLTDDELAVVEARSRESQARIEAQDRERAAARAATNALRTAPKSFDDYRREHIKFSGQVLAAMALSYRGESGMGYRYAPDVCAEIDAHVVAVLALLEHGRVEFHAETYDAERARLHAVAARGDPSFARFMVKARAR